MIVALLTLVGGLVGSYITSALQNEASKREINLKTLSFLAHDFLKEKPIVMKKGLGEEQINQILQHKETAFLAGELTQHLMTNHDYIDFRNLQAALVSIERRYSYAQIYQAAGLSSVICENLVGQLGDRSLQITSRLSKCEESELEGIILTLVSIDQKNNRFRIKISNDQKHLICKGDSDTCSFWIDLGDRLESTPYKYLFLAEYIGYNDVYNQKDPIVAFSILKRKEEVISYPKPYPRKADSSYWTYKLDDRLLSSNSGPVPSVGGCAAFFDSSPTTIAQPDAPVLDQFGKGVLKACGPIRGSVTDKEFEALVDDYYLDLRAHFPKSWGQLQKKEVIAKLKQIWMTQNGFNHVFCGEWKERRIGGLHYRGRYLQLQIENSACYMASRDEEIVEDHIYTIGVTSADGANRHYKKGYALQQSATELFALGTSAFERCVLNSEDWKRYGDNFDQAFYIESPSGDTKIQNQVICKAFDSRDAGTYGLLTIYSDATPSDGD